MPPLTYPEFQPQTWQDWAKTLSAESKNGLAPEQLEWEAASGLKLEAIYTADHKADTAWLDDFMTAQMALRKNAGWLYLEEIAAIHAHTANSDARHALEGGAGAVAFWWQTEAIPYYPELFRDLALRTTPVWLRGAAEQMPLFSELIRKNNPGLHALQGGLWFDPISDLIAHGRPFTQTDLQILAKQCQEFAEAPHFYTIHVSGLPYAEAGADAIQELAFTLSALVEYQAMLELEGFGMSEVASKTLITLSLGTHFFTDITKMRAMRVLLGRLMNVYDLDPIYFPIQARGSIFSQTLADPDSNLIRNSTAALAAVIGNADYITLLPHENGAQAQSSSMRLARNNSNLLRGEVYAGKTLDMASGSYFVDTFTIQLAEKAWQLFQETEAKGGFLAAASEKFIQGKVLESQAKRIKAYSSKEEVLVGGNLFAIATETEWNKSGTYQPNPELLEPVRLADC